MGKEGSKSISKTLKSAKVEFVRVLWCDNANIIRAKAFHVSTLADHWQTGVGISKAQQAIPVMYDGVSPNAGLGPVGEVWLVPDWETLGFLPFAPTHAQVMGTMTDQGQPWSLCPRHFLQRMVTAANQLGVQIQAAFENEFYLLKTNSSEILPNDRTVFAATAAMNQNCSVIDGIVAALSAQNIQVERYYPESGPGQQEISIRYAPALTAADHQIAFREVVRGVVHQQGLVASFLPKIFADQAGNGCHLHFSLWQDGENITPDPQQQGHLSPIARQFMAGILHHLPALMALTTPSVNSYRRLKAHCWSGAFRCWGYDNREAALRVPSNPQSPSPTHIELKTTDASANPYIALGGVIAAGLDGIRRQLEPGEPVAIDPGNFSDSERQERGIDPLPDHLGAAIAQFSQNTVLQEAMGAELVQAYLAVRKVEWEAMKGMNLAEEVHLLLERY
uniref:Glutamine synthetase catalytic region n=1 Tax=Cyanothece sp. (strain PCC 7425 / ATCC 29141) TaxID=395961 RepID=B8HRT8_CYAP4